jgi:molecular chaperone GrpE
MNDDELPRVAADGVGALAGAVLADDTPAAAAPGGPAGATGLSERLSAVERQLSEFHRRAAHRELIIDRLHEENQQLKQGLHRTVLEPVVADLIRLYDQLYREARRSGADGGLIGSFADEVAEILDRCGVEVFAAVPGEPHQVDRHRPLGVVPTTVPALHNTVAEAVAAGFFDRDSGRVRRPAQARFHQYDADGEN